MSCNIGSDLRPANWPIKIWRNNTWSQTFAIFDGTTPIDLSGSTIVIQVRTSAEAPEATLTLSTTSSTITITGDDHNQITLNKKVDIPAGNYVYDIDITFPSMDSKTYVWGTFYVQEDITKP